MNQQSVDVGKLREVVEKERRRLAGDPNVLGVGLGPKEVGGERVPGVVVRYAVRRKLPEDEVGRAGSEPLPSEVEGFTTDVYEPELSRPHNLPTGARGTRREEPLVGGTSTTVLSDWHSFPTGYGTLGGLCFDDASGDAMAISNAHVWGEDLGRDVIQPWTPVDEYLEAAVKLMACGPTISYLADWTAPSPLTAGLGAAAAAAWVAAAASDEEDPNRWGQRVTDPAPGARTSAERIGLTAPLPSNPMPGFPYSVETRWDYTRITDAGSHQEAIEEKRRNPHVLVGKRVWTERQQYAGGQRVEICAEIASLGKARRPGDYFVVAHCFPTSGGDRVVRRVLEPGDCRVKPPRQAHCFSGFPKPDPKAPQGSEYPFHHGVYRFSSDGERVLHGIQVDGSRELVALRIPFEGLRVDFVPVGEVAVEVSHTAYPVTVLALDPLGRVVDRAEGGPQQSETQTLKLEGELISAVRVEGGGGEGYLHGLCLRQALPDVSHDRFRRFTYTGHLDLGLREARDRWGVMLSVHTVDNSPPGTDPVQAAQNLGGIPAAANTAQLATCVTVMLLDHVFDVI